MKDVLYANGLLLKNWLIHIGEEGNLHEIFNEESTKKGLSDKIKGSVGIISGDVNLSQEKEKKQIKKILIDSQFWANKIACESSYHDLVSTYSDALKLVSKSKDNFVRYVLLDVFLTYIASDNGFWIGDIIVIDAMTNPNLTIQYLVRIDSLNNAADSPSGLMGRRTQLLTFWREGFKPPNDKWLSQCEAVLIWN